MEKWNIISGLIAALASGGFGWLLNSSRRKASAEAKAAEEDAIDLREKRYENIFQFMQEKLAKSMEDLALKNKEINEMHAEVLRLTRERYEMEMNYINSRCDERGCDKRKPPLKWENAARGILSNK